MYQFLFTHHLMQVGVIFSFYIMNIIAVMNIHHVQVFVWMYVYISLELNL